MLAESGVVSCNMLVQKPSPRIFLASWMSLGMMATLFVKSVLVASFFPRVLPVDLHPISFVFSSPRNTTIMLMSALQDACRFHRRRHSLRRASATMLCSLLSPRPTSSSRNEWMKSTASCGLITFHSPSLAIIRNWSHVLRTYSVTSGIGETW